MSSAAPVVEAPPENRREFRATPWLPGGHLQTVVPSLWPAPAVPGVAEPLWVKVGPDSEIRVDVNRPSGPKHGTVVLVHGMCGSADSAYMRRTAALALERGLVAARVNLRGCGGTETRSSSLHNAGQSEDVGRVVQALDRAQSPRPYLVVGYSLGGNIVLRHAGIGGTACGADAVAAVNPPVDLARCAAAIEQPRNRLYQLYYTRSLCRALGRFRELRGIPGGRPRTLEVRTVRRFDQLYTAPASGYPSADAYYADASAGSRLGGVRVPTLVLSAADDPIVPVEMFEPFRGCPAIRFDHPARGGHCGYWQSGRPRSWAAQAVLDFAAQSARG